MNPFHDYTTTDIEQLKAQILPLVTVENFLTLLKAVTFYADPDTYVGIAVYVDDPAGAFADDFGCIHAVGSNHEIINTDMLAGAEARSALHTVFMGNKLPVEPILCNG